MNEFWFKPHRYGLGAAPKSWEGCALVAAYVAAMAALSLWLMERWVAFTAAAVLLTAIFLFVAWSKTEGGWRWRWGERE